jgi:hypothetical protein
VADVDCGISLIKSRTAKIVNGEETVEGEFPWYLRDDQINLKM